MGGGSWGGLTSHPELLSTLFLTTQGRKSRSSLEAENSTSTSDLFALEKRGLHPRVRGMCGAQLQ